MSPTEAKPPKAPEKDHGHMAHDAARKQSKFGWALASGAMLFLVALALWMNKLQESAGVTDEDKKQVSVRPPDPDGTPTPGEPLAVPFEQERCRPWHVSAAAAKPGPKARFILLGSSIVDPYGLVVGGFAEACGAEQQTLVAENLEDGQLAKEIAEQKPMALVLVGAAALARARTEAQGLPWLYAKIPDALSQGLDSPGKIGVSPWIPMAATLKHVLQPLPRSKSKLAVFFAPAMAELGQQAAEAIRADGREATLLRLESPQHLDSVLVQAQEKTNAWFVIPDRQIINHEIYNRIQVKAEEHKIPLLVTDEEHVRAGAYAGVGPDSFRIGAQLCHLAGALERGELPKGSQLYCPEYSFSAVHQAMVEKLGYILDPDQLKQAKLYRWH